MKIRKILNALGEITKALGREASSEMSQIKSHPLWRWFCKVSIKRNWQHELHVQVQLPLVSDLVARLDGSQAVLVPWGGTVIKHYRLNYCTPLHPWVCSHCHQLSKNAPAVKSRSSQAARLQQLCIPRSITGGDEVSWCVHSQQGMNTPALGHTNWDNSLLPAPSCWPEESPWLGSAGSLQCPSLLLLGWYTQPRQELLLDLCSPYRQDSDRHTPPILPSLLILTAWKPGPFCPRMGVKRDAQNWCPQSFSTTEVSRAEKAQWIIQIPWIYFIFNDNVFDNLTTLYS